MAVCRSSGIGSPGPHQRLFFNLQFFSKLLLHKVQTLLIGNADTPIVRTVVLPSFDPEYTVSIDSIAPDTYRLCHAVCSPKVWGANEEINVIRTETDIDGKSVAAVKKLYLTAITQTAIPKKDDYILAEGIKYVFIADFPDQGTYSGTRRSPKAGSKMREMVSASDILTKMTIEKNAKKYKKNYSIASIT